jgi:hypothetical protein
MEMEKIVIKRMTMKSNNTMCHQIWATVLWLYNWNRVEKSADKLSLQPGRHSRTNISITLLKV